MISIWITREEMLDLGNRYNCALSLNKLLEWHSKMKCPEEFLLQKDVDLIFMRRTQGSLYGTWVELQDLIAVLDPAKSKEVLLTFF